jgi:hypothetical protein
MTFTRSIGSRNQRLLESCTTLQLYPSFVLFFIFLKRVYDFGVKRAGCGIGIGCKAQSLLMARAISKDCNAAAPQARARIVNTFSEPVQHR